ncbi:hypothetical protein [Zavarzinella formosa]|uniref:hypothetical protein n=1 Tax=Zavarzinella formosa TaxID=360055 RepID=UPI00031EA580|nr:hypothetical protein [Zavarzinella formosa]
MEWDRDTYFEDTCEGEHWAVTFHEGGAVVVFFSSESTRNPFPEGSPPYDQSWFFRGMPQWLEPVRDLALSEMHDFNFRCRNPTGAVITAAMWADGERFTAVEQWEDVYHHSCWACRTHLLPPEEALRWWLQGIGFPETVMPAAWSLYQRRVTSTSPVVMAEPSEWRALLEIAGGDPNRTAGYAEGMLADVGIVLEP